MDGICEYRVHWEQGGALNGAGALNGMNTVGIKVSIKFVICEVIHIQIHVICFCGFANVNLQKLNEIK